MNWYLNVLKEHYADFNGRARRKEYWMFTLIHIIIITSIIGFAFILSEENNADEEGNYIVFILLGIYILATIVPSIALTVRRLHDIGKSGWVYLINFIPYIGRFIMLVYTCMDSQPRVNKWGKNPKGVGNDADINLIGKE